MSTTDRVERDITAWFGETAAPATPDYTDDILRQTARSRQRPRWTFPERWLPMSVITFGRVNLRPVPWRTVGLLAVLGLLLAVAAAVYVGSQPATPSAAVRRGGQRPRRVLEGRRHLHGRSDHGRATRDRHRRHRRRGPGVLARRNPARVRPDGGQRPGDRRGRCRRAQPGRDPDDAAGRGVSSGLVAGWSMDRRHRRRRRRRFALDRRYRRRDRPEDRRPRRSTTRRSSGARPMDASWPSSRRRACQIGSGSRSSRRASTSSTSWHPSATSGASSGRAAGRPTGADSSTPRIHLGDRFTLSRSTVGAMSRSSRAWRGTARSTHGCRTTVDVSCSWNRAPTARPGCPSPQATGARPAVRVSDIYADGIGTHYSWSPDDTHDRVRAQRRSQRPARSRRRSRDHAVVDHRGRRVLAAPARADPQCAIRGRPPAAVRCAGDHRSPASSPFATGPS